MRLLFALLLAVLLAPAPAHAQKSSGNLAGAYAMEGADGAGTTYQGTATITQVAAARYAVRFDVNNAVVEGIGIVDGDNFAVGFTDNSQYGVLLYRIQSDGSLQASWAVSDVDGIGRETLTPQRR